MCYIKWAVDEWTFSFSIFSPNKRIILAHFVWMDELVSSSGSLRFCGGVWRRVVITVCVTAEYPYWKSVSACCWIPLFNKRVVKPRYWRPQSLLHEVLPFSFSWGEMRGSSEKLCSWLQELSVKTLSVVQADLAVTVCWTFLAWLCLISGNLTSLFEIFSKYNNVCLIIMQGHFIKLPAHLPPFPPVRW